MLIKALLKKELQSIKKLDNLSQFTTVGFSQSATVAANGAKQVNFNIAKSGYTPIGIVGASVGGTGSSAARIYQWILESPTARLLITNDSATQRTWTAVVVVLYQKLGGVVRKLLNSLTIRKVVGVC